MSSAKRVFGGRDSLRSTRRHQGESPHNLPELLADRLRTALGITPGRGILVKDQPTAELKNLSDPHKLAALEGRFRVTRSLEGKAVVLVDDLVFSGTTLSYLGQLLRDAGAVNVIGLAATKTWRT